MADSTLVLSHNDENINKTNNIKYNIDNSVEICKY